MTVNRTAREIRRAFENITPNVLDRVLSQSSLKKGAVTPMQEKKPFIPYAIQKIASAAAVVVLLIAIGAVALMILNGRTNPQLSDNPTEPPTEAPTDSEEIPEGPLPQPYFTYSPYAVNAYSKEEMGEDYSLYCALVDAVLNYETRVSGFSSEEQFLNLWITMRDELPPAWKLCAGYLDFDEPYIYADGTVELKFVLDKNAHMALLDAYAQRIQRDISTLLETDTEVERIAKVYQCVVNSMKYSGTQQRLYDAIMNNRGVSSDFAEYMMILLNQIGVECYFAQGYGEGIEVHTWVIAKMDGKYYHFDPTWEQDFRNWYWFAIDDQLRRDSVLPEWRNLFIMGGDYEDVNSEGVIVVGKISHFTYQRIPLPICTEKYKEDSRCNGIAPWLW